MSELPRLTSAAQINKPVELECEWVPVPELGYEVPVWALSGLEVMKWEAKNVRTKGGRVIGLNLDSSTQRLLMAAIRNEDGTPIFTEATISWLMAHGGATVKKLEDVARRLSGLSVADDEDDESDSDSDQGRARGNGVAGHPGMTSITGSPSPSVGEPATNS